MLRLSPSTQNNDMRCCRWYATDALQPMSWPLPQMLWPPAVSRAGQAASRSLPSAPTATRTGLPACSPDCCMLTAMCWPASQPRAAPPWTCCPASWLPSAVTAALLPVSGAGLLCWMMFGPVVLGSSLAKCRDVFWHSYCIVVAYC